jgi:hypothetical protein
MNRLILALILGLVFLPRFTLAKPNEIYKYLMLKHGSTAYVYKVYAAKCDETETKVSDNTIILKPGDPIEISYIDESGTINILLVYSIPCPPK